MAAATIKPLTVADRDWFTWGGVGGPPRGTYGRVIEIRLRDGTETIGVTETMFWDHVPHAPACDIVAYRLAECELPADPAAACTENYRALRADCPVDFKHIEPEGMIDLLGDEPPEPLTLPTTGPYAGLARTLYAAFQQASAGKGKERHAVADVAFEDQPMATINRQLGSIDGFIYQAHKKSLEAKRLPDGRAQAELLGAINYLAGAARALDTWAKKPA